MARLKYGVEASSKEREMTLSGSAAWLCMLKSPATRQGKSTLARASGEATDLVDPGRECE